MERKKGIGAVVLSSLLFGVTPALARLTYLGGNTSMQMVFLRSFLALPVLLGILLRQKISLRVSRRELLHLLLGGFLGSAATTMCLYASYQYISVGVATSIHFAYPLLVVCAGALFFQETITLRKGIALAGGLVGILLLGEGDGALAIAGVALALFSAVTFAFKVIWMGRSSLGQMDSMKVTFYFCLCDCVCSALVGGLSGQMPRAMTGQAWLLSLAVALLLSVVAVPCLKYGIEQIGSSSASILSTLEPVASIVVGVWLLHEAITGRKVLGCLLILCSVLCVALTRQPTAPPQTDDSAA